MNGPEEQFQQALAAGELRIQHCGACARSVFPPRVFCPHCSGEALEWRAAGGGGEVHSTTTVRMLPKGQEPYNVTLVELDEGVRVMGRAVAAPVVIGSRVRVVVEGGKLAFLPEGDTP